MELALRSFHTALLVQLPFIHRCRAFIFSAAVMLIVTTSVAQRPEDSVAVQQSLSKYCEYVRHMQPDSIASLFTVNGEVVNPGSAPIIGLHAIRTHLQQFASFTVIDHTMVTDSLSMQNTNATQFGTFAQRVRLPSGDTIDVAGRFRIEWVRLPYGPWLIRQMETHR